jgi:uncharacterized protein YecT (DUF1311 family)
VLRFALAASLSLLGSAAAQACDAPEDVAEPALQGAYERAWAGADEEGRELIARSQIAWRDYRSANCEMYASRGGWIAADAYAQCLRYMTEERMQDLRLVCLTLGDGQDCERAP